MPIPVHRLIRRKEAKDFDQLFHSLGQMHNISAKMMNDFLNSLNNPKIKTLESICQKDSKLDQLEIEINEAAVAIISRWQPVAGDLRMLIATLKIATAYERIGDYIHNNCKKFIFALNNGLAVEHINRQILQDIGKSLKHLMMLIAKDLKNRSSNYCQQIINEDAIIDEIYGQLYRQSLATTDSKKIAGVIKTVMIAKYLERIGDQLTNIAEALSYAIRGTPFSPER